MLIKNPLVTTPSEYIHFHQLWFVLCRKTLNPSNDNFDEVKESGIIAAKSNDFVRHCCRRELRQKGLSQWAVRISTYITNLYQQPMKLWDGNVFTGVTLFKGFPRCIGPHYTWSLTLSLPFLDMGHVDFPKPPLQTWGPFPSGTDIWWPLKHIWLANRYYASY